MIDNSSPNFSFDELQVKQLDEFQGRLANLQSEITIARKGLANVQAEAVKATVEKQYQEGLLKIAQEQVETAKGNLDSVTAQVVEKTTEFGRLSEEVKTLRLEVEKRNEELLKRERDLAIKLEEHAFAVEEFNIHSKKLSEDLLSVQSAKEAFLKAIESITWK